MVGTVIRACGPKSVLIELSDGRTIRRHVNHVRSRAHDYSSEQADDEASDWTITVPDKPGFEIATPVPAVVPPVRPTATSLRVSSILQKVSVLFVY